MIYFQATLFNGLTILWDGNRRIYIKAPPSLKNSTMGLCGFYDGRQNNDFMTQQNIVESNPREFAKQWATGSCPDVSFSTNDPCMSQPHIKLKAEKLCSHLKNNTFEGIDILNTF